MSSPAPLSCTELWTYNQHLLEQAQSMLGQLQKRAADTTRFAQAIGPHLRHIVEHYQALLCVLPGNRLSLPTASQDDTSPPLIEYDARASDKSMESDMVQAGEHTHVVCTALQQMAQASSVSTYASTCTTLTSEQAVNVRLQAGLQGEQECVLPSTLGRELMFLASHTIHHFALLSHYCKEMGVDLGADFAKAPSTIAFEQQ